MKQNNKMKVLIACEFSGTVRDWFTKMGHEATSCDIVPSETPGEHYQGNVLDILDQGWDLMIAHPPCTYLAVSGAQWYYHPEDSLLPTSERRPHPKFPNRQTDRKEAVDFFMALANAPIPRIAIENPIGIMSTTWKKPSQVIHPWQFGHEASKSTCLWLKNLPLLVPTNIVDKGEFVTFKSGKKMSKWYAEAASKNASERAKIRNRTFDGIASAFANQWGILDNK
jgi:hypothetical protein